MNIIDTEYTDSIAQTASELLTEHNNQYNAILTPKIEVPVMVENADPLNTENHPESQAELESEPNNDIMFGENFDIPIASKSQVYNYLSYFKTAEFPDGSRTISGYNNLNISEENFRHLTAEEVSEIAESLPSLKAKSAESTNN